MGVFHRPWARPRYHTGGYRNSRTRGLAAWKGYAVERTRYSISGGLSSEAIERIIADAFRLLDSVGVTVEDENVLAELKRHKGVRVDGGLAFYSPQLVEEFIGQVHGQNDEYMLNVPGRAEPLVRPPFLCMRVWDLEAGCARPASVHDLTRAVKLLDTYGVEGIPPIHPQEIPPPLRQIVTAKVSYENSRAIGSYMQATSVREVELLCELGEAAGCKGPHVALQIVHSPLKLDANSLRLILELKRSKRTARGVTAGAGAMPLAGAAAPLLLPGFLAQGLAEALAAYGTPKLLNDGVTGYCSIFPGTFDMRYTGYSMASAEAIVYWLAIRQLMQHLFVQTMGGDFACTGKTYDAQAGAQKMAAILTAVLSGATTFCNAGMTPTDEVFHFEGAVIDMEILSYAWRVGKGVAWEDAPTAEIVKEGRAADTFLMHPATMRFREEIWDPPLFTNESLGRWLAQGSPGVIEKAARIAEERIAAHSYHPSKDVQREFDRIMKIAEKDLT